MIPIISEAFTVLRWSAVVIQWLGFKRVLFGSLCWLRDFRAVIMSYLNAVICCSDHSIFLLASLLYSIPSGTDKTPCVTQYSLFHCWMCMILRILISVHVFKMSVFCMVEFPQASFIERQVDMFGVPWENPSHGRILTFWHFDIVRKSTGFSSTEIGVSLTKVVSNVSQPNVIEWHFKVW